MVNIILFVLFFREKMEALFNQLKRELLSPDNTMEDSFNLLNELRIATERNFALKKMFWKVWNCIWLFGLWMF